MRLCGRGLKSRHQIQNIRVQTKFSRPISKPGALCVLFCSDSMSKAAGRHTEYFIRLCCPLPDQPITAEMASSPAPQLELMLTFRTSAWGEVGAPVWPPLLLPPLSFIVTAVCTQQPPSLCHFHPPHVTSLQS